MVALAFALAVAVAAVAVVGVAVAVVFFWISTSSWRLSFRLQLFSQLKVPPSWLCAQFCPETEGSR